MLEDAVHGVSGLLSRHPQILLQRPGDAAERRDYDNDDKDDNHDNNYLGKMDWAAS